jgi:hypothetical protein
LDEPPLALQAAALRTFAQNDLRLFLECPKFRPNPSSNSAAVAAAAATAAAAVGVTSPSAQRVRNGEALMSMQSTPGYCGRSMVVESYVYVDSTAAAGAGGEAVKVAVPPMVDMEQHVLIFGRYCSLLFAVVLWFVVCVLCFVFCVLCLCLRLRLRLC